MVNNSYKKIKGYKLSYAQERMFVMYKLDPNSVYYNIHHIREVDKNLDISIFGKSLNLIVGRHEILRTNFKEINGTGIQFINFETKFKLKVIREKNNKIIDEIIEKWINTPFDLEKDSLIRAILIQNKNRNILILTIHHIVTDDWSMNLFYKELKIIYNALIDKKEPVLPKLNLQYKDYAEWERSKENEIRLKDQEKYWLKRLSGEIPILNLPIDRPRQAVQKFKGDKENIILNKRLTDSLRKISRDNNVTLFTLLFTIFNVFLYKITNQDDIIVATPSSDRNHMEIESNMGFFINMLAIRTKIKSDQTFEGLLQETQNNILETLHNKEYPFAKLVEKLNPERDMSINPIFNCSFQIIELNNKNDRRNKLNNDYLKIKIKKTDNHVVKFDLVFIITETLNNELILTCEYNTDLFNKKTIERFLLYIETLIKNIINNQEEKIKDLDIIYKKERYKLIHIFNDTRKKYFKNKNLHQLFEEKVQKHPDKIAIEYKEKKINYQELNQKINSLAHFLKSKKKLKINDRVGILLDKSPEMIISVLAVLKVGGTYIPFDVNNSKVRNNIIINQSNIKFVITSKKYLKNLSKTEKIDINQINFYEYPVDNLNLFINSENLAYIIYTSGSTGVPKGVAVSHFSVVNLIDWLNIKFKININDKLLFVSPFCFDLSVYDIFGTLASGASIQVISDEETKDPKVLAEYIINKNITIWNSTPMIMEQVMSILEIFKIYKKRNLLRLVLLSGDWIPLNLPSRIKETFTSVKVIALGGATEATVWSNYHEVRGARKGWSSIPYGRPIQNSQYYILNNKLQLLPVGIPGELYISGDVLAQGYIYDIKRTKEVFLDHPFKKGEKIYKTGDLAKIHEDGNIEILGRIDNQIKIRGYRIEPGEIEFNLDKHNYVKDAVVDAQMETRNFDTKKKNKYLIAYYVLEDKYAYILNTISKLEIKIAKKTYQLLNGLRIFSFNKNETDFMYNKIFKDNIYLKYGFKFKKNACIFDVGANIGLFSLRIEELIKDPKIYAFEPIPDVFNLLKFNTKIYNKNIKDWNKIQQIVLEVHKEKGDFECIIRLLTKKGYRVGVDRGDDVENLFCVVYATRLIGDPKGTKIKKSTNNYLCDFRSIAKDLKDYLKQRLPEYMIPNVFVPLQKLPVNKNGKLDRSRLPKPKEEYFDKNKYIKPKTATEIMIAEIWQTVLDVKKIGINDDFFNLGGHSLKAIQVLANINKTFKIDLPLKELFQYSVLSDLGRIIDKKKNGMSQIVIKKSKDKKYYKLTYAQKRMFVLYKFEPNSATYNINNIIEIEGNFNINIFKKSIDKIIKRHEVFRTNFKEILGGPVQIIKKNYKLRITSYELDKIKDKENKDTLIMVMHHIISDGVSNNILLQELTHTYNALAQGKKPELKKLDIQYKDYADWEQNINNKQRLKKQEKYWLNELSGNLPVLELPLDKSRPVIQTHCGKVVETVINPKITQRLKDLSKERRVTLFTLLFTIFNVFLYRISGQTDIIVGVPITNRRYSETQDIIGCFLNNLSIRSDLSKNIKFIEFLEKTKEKIIDASDNGEYSFEHLIEKLKIKRDMSRSPIFDVMFQIEEKSDYINNKKLDGLKFKIKPRVSITSKFSLKIRAIETKQKGIILSCKYNTDLFNKRTIEGFLSVIQILIKGIIDNPEVNINDLEIIEKKEAKRLIKEINDTKVKYPKDKLLHELFEEQAKINPERMAVEYEGQRLKYRELNDKANKLAHYLRSKTKLKLEEVVGIATERDLDLAIATIAVHKAGGSCLLIDTSYPEVRIKEILKDAQIGVVLVSKKAAIRDWSTRGGSAKIKNKLLMAENFNIININDKEIDKYEKNNINIIVKPTSLAYMIYTSGSTGRPKGVMLSHRNIVNSIYHRKNIMNISSKDVLCLSVLTGFVAMTFKFYNPLTSGAKLIIYGEEIVRNAPKLFKAVDRDRVTVLDVGLQNLITYLNYIQDNSKEKALLKDLRILLPVGEKLNKDTTDLFFKEYEGINIFTTYGMTEFAGIIFKNKIDRKKNEKINKITEGRVPQNSQVYILDKNLKLLPPNTRGDIYYSGDSLSSGYLNNPQKTKEVFLEHPFVKGKTIFKTGDIGKINDSGELEVIGRSDHQVKIRGYRIELGEIESKLREYKDIEKCMVIVDGKREYLIAYYTSKTKKKKIEVQKLRNYLKEILSNYMVPDIFVYLKEMPLNQNGKLDRLSLPEPKEKDLDKNKYEAPKTDIEKRIANIWQEVLNIKKIGLNDNFFNLGGHSLKAIQVLARINKEFDIDLGLKELFKYPILNELSKEVEKELNKENKKTAVIIPKTKKKEYYKLSYAQQKIFIWHKLDPDSYIYNLNIVLRLEEDIKIKQFKKAVAELAERHEVLRTRFLEINGEAVQMVGDKSIVKLQIQNISDSGSEEREMIEIEAAIEKIIRMPFNLKEEAPFRIAVFKHQNIISTTGQKKKEILIISIHHIAVDQWSMQMLIRELFKIYEACLKEEKPDLPKLSIQYKDYAEWEQSEENQKRLEAQKKYWLARLGENPPVSSLPLDYPRKSILEYQKGYVCDYLDNKIIH